MKIIIDDSARQSLIDVYYYNCQYSLKYAIEINRYILYRIANLENSPYIGRYIPEMSDKRFREIICQKNSRHSGYRIIYYISENTDTIYILSIFNTKQDFNHILKLNNYFTNFFNF